MVRPDGIEQCCRSQVNTGICTRNIYCVPSNVPPSLESMQRGALKITFKQRRPCAQRDPRRPPSTTPKANCQNSVKEKPALGRSLGCSWSSKAGRLAGGHTHRFQVAVVDVCQIVDDEAHALALKPQGLTIGCYLDVALERRYGKIPYVKSSRARLVSSWLSIKFWESALKPRFGGVRRPTLKE